VVLGVWAWPILLSRAFGRSAERDCLLRPTTATTVCRSVIERTHAWGNQYGRLRWCAERRRLVVEFWLALASAIIVCGRLVRRAWSCYRWESRPRRRP
jgi:hypothetical protein